MSQDISFAGRRYISAADAAQEFDFTRDYIARLCREGRVQGRKMGKSWYVDEISLKEFLILQEYERSLRQHSLRHSRATEYRASAGPKMDYEKDSAASVVVDRLGVTTAQHGNLIAESAKSVALQPAVSDTAFRAVTHGLSHVPVYSASPVMEFFHKILALTTAIFIVLGAYSSIDRRFVDSIVSLTGRGAVAAREFYNTIRDFRASPEASYAAIAAFYSRLSPQSQGESRDELPTAHFPASNSTITRISKNVVQNQQLQNTRVNEMHAYVLCLSQSSEKEICVTGEDLARLLFGARTPQK